MRERDILRKTAASRTDSWKMFSARPMRCCLVSAILLILTAACSPVSAADYYVAPDGRDENPGTKARPLRTVQRAADAMSAGDTCYIREGTYRESVTLRRSGTEGKPIRFIACPGEVVVLSGAEPVNGRWNVHKGSIYKTRTDKDFAQLFVDGKMMFEARWPNADIEDLWNPKSWASTGLGSRYGKIVDPELAVTGIDWTGALATMNLAHQFYTWTRTVRSHSKGSDTFEYDKNLPGITHFADKTRPWEDDFYYLTGKLEALDSPGEWFLDRENNTLYLWTPDGKNPASHKVEVKARNYAFQADGLDHVEIRGLHFFAATFKFAACNYCVVDGCHLRFPTYSRRIGEFDRPRTPVPSTFVSGSHNVVRNCSLAYASNAGLKVRGSYNLVENNLIYDICWSGSLTYTGISIGPLNRKDAAGGCVVKGNTVFNTGGPCIQVGGLPGTILEYNHVHHGGLACKDISLLYTGSPLIRGTVMRYNWVHDSLAWDRRGKGIRGDDQTRGLIVHHNVVWNCCGVGIIAKGDDNKVCNNTCFNNGDIDIMIPQRPEPVKPWRKQFPLLEQQNQNTQTVNNCAPFIAGRRVDIPTPGEVSNNYKGKEAKLADPSHFDFRPARGSPLIDAGKRVPGITDDFQGKAPDIGAYEHGDDRWIPGYGNMLRLFALRNGGNIVLKAALAMPPLEPVDIQVFSKTGRAAARMQFRPDNWMRPQEVGLKLPGGGGKAVPVRFVSEVLGTVEVRDIRKVMSPEGQVLPFKGGRVPGMKELVLRAMPTRPGLTPGVMPVARAFKLDKVSLKVDGRLGAGEWTGMSPERELLLLPLANADQAMGPAGSAYVLFDDANIYVAFRIRKPDATPVRRGASWGDTDGVEVCMQTSCDEKFGPVFVVHGFPSGKFESVTDAGASEADAKKLEKAVSYAAKVEKHGWTAEYKIPFSGLGVSPGKVERLRFNVGAAVITRDGRKWFAWARTGSANWKLEKAGELAFRPVCLASERNILRNGSIEEQDGAPWRTTAPAESDEMRASIAKEGPDGSWCLKIECTDRELMKEAKVKWMQSVPKDLPPGDYVLSYYVRVAGFVRVGDIGMVCGYLHIRRDGKPGGNLGQRDYAIRQSNMPWTRRDCVITIPEGVEPSSVILQLHQSTGTVWFDNASLLRCR